MVQQVSEGQDGSATLPRQSPPYWSKYAFVDINRDAHQLVHRNHKAVSRMFLDWHPQIDARSARERARC